MKEEKNDPALGPPAKVTKSLGYWEGLDEWDYDAGYSGYGGAVEPGPSKGFLSRTWDRAKSFSGSFRSRWGDSWGTGMTMFNPWSWGGGSNPTKDKLLKALHQLGRTVNVVRNSSEAGKAEKPLYLTWQDERESQINGPDSDCVVLSPDVLTQAKPGEEDVAMDVLSGQSLLASGMKASAHEDSFNDCRDDLMAEKPVAPVAQTMWQAVEQAIARSEVLKDWSGFMPYFQQHENMLLSSKEEVENYLNVTAALKPSAAAAAHAIAWNTLHPKDPVTVPEVYRQAVDEGLAEIKSGGKKPKLRYQESRTVAEKLLKIWPPDPQDKDKNGGGDGAGPPQPKTSDSSLFGDRVKNDKSPDGDLPNEISVEDAEDPANVIFVPSGCGRLDPKPYRGNLVTCDSAIMYKQLVSEMRLQIDHIVNALAFRNTDVADYNRGLTRGDLDPGALHKLALREHEPAVFEQQEIIAKTEIAVGILIDQSGSMNGTKIVEARKVAVAMTEALRRVKGVIPMVLGHTANCRGNAEARVKGRVSTQDGTKGKIVADTLRVVPGQPESELEMDELFTFAHKNPYAVACAGSYANNADGYAMEFSARKMARDYPGMIKLLFVISDGQPAAEMPDSECSGYGSEPAAHHMKNVCDFSACKLGVQIKGIGICNAYDANFGDMAYGPGNYIILDNVMDSIHILTRFLRKIANKV